MGKRFTEKGLYFADAEKTILIGCSNTMEGILKIPATAVTIGEEAFSENRAITGIDFSECKNLKTIERGAFSYCQELIKLDFSGCTSLFSLNEAAFFECPSLTEVIFPSNLNKIGEKTFYACNSLTEIKFPPKLKTIESHAFADCKNIISLDLSSCESLDKISKAAFRGCTQAKVKMPASIETIETYALGEIVDNDEDLMCYMVIVPNYKICKKVMSSSYHLYRIIVENRVIENGLCFADAEKTILIGEEEVNSGILKIPESVVTIGTQAFAGNEDITGIDFSECRKLENIESNAFAYCTGLVHLDFSDCVRLGAIFFGAFYKCTGLKSLNFSGNKHFALIQANAFEGCTALTDLDLPSSIIEIDEETFKDCTSLRKIDLAKLTSLEIIGDGAFEGCTSLAEIIFPTTSTFALYKIGERAFKDCTNLTSLDLSEYTNFPTIEDSSFEGCIGLTEALLPPNISSIGRKAFRGCTGLRKMDLSAYPKLTNIGKSAFDKCAGMTEISIPPDITLIDSYAFVNCSGLTNLDLSDCKKLKEIRDGAFSGCKGLTEVTFPPNLNHIETWAFHFCENITELVFPQTLLTIEKTAFEWCENLLSADLSACFRLEKIQEGAFGYCEKASIKLPERVVKIYENAFSYPNGACCKNVTVPNFEIYRKVVEANYHKDKIICEGGFVDENGFVFLDSEKTILIGRECSQSHILRIPETVTIIEEGAFKGEANISRIDFFACKGLKTIKKGAFEHCENLSGTIMFPADLEEVQAEAFLNCRYIEALDFSVCVNLKYIGVEAFLNCRYINQVDFSGCAKLEGISQASFARCFCLKKIDFSGCTGLKTIDYNAFLECSDLLSVDLSGCTNLTEISYSAFFGCSKAKIKLPASVEKIAYGAFQCKRSWCKKITVTTKNVYEKVAASKYPLERIVCEGFVIEEEE